MSDLHELLERATDRIEAPSRAAEAIVTARRRRVRQRGIVTGALAAVAVVAVVVVVQAAGGDSATREPPPASQAPTESAGQVRWDPRDVDRLPVAVVPHLPARLDVPDLAPHVEDDPVEAAVLSVDDGADVLLLGVDGRWRCVVVPDRSGADPTMSPDGTRLYVPVADGVVTVNLATGTQTRRPVGSVPVIPDIGWVTPSLDAAADAWVVRAVAGLRDGAVLLRVEPPREDRWWLVQWEPRSNSFSLVTSVHSDPAKPASFARGLLGSP